MTLAEPQNAFYEETATFSPFVLKMASIDRLMPFLVACHCTIFIVNLLFCYVTGK